MSNNSPVKVVLKVGETKRMDCPSCNGKNTFTVTNDGRNYLWNCYRASCELRGGKRAAVRLEGLVAHAKDIGREEPIDTSVFRQPNGECLEMLTKYNSIRAYVNGYVNCWWDMLRDRLVFGICDPKYITYSGDMKYVVDYMGRALVLDRVGFGGRLLPKWKRYGKTLHPFICPDQYRSYNRLVIVEDAFSACAVHEVATGVALLGTTLHEQHIIDIVRLQPKEIIVCLDHDAQHKSLDISEKLRYYVDTIRIVDPPNDLKHFTTTEIADILNLKEI